MNGAGLAARYAFPPNRHGYCGSSSFRPALRDFLRGKKPPKSLEPELKKFRTHYAYLILIARENGLRPFDPEVVEALWIGNSLLENVSERALRSFIRDLFPSDPSRVKELVGGLPDGVVPHHSFNALYINFVTDAVEKTTENYDSCCVTAGEIVSLSQKSALVRRFSIARDKDGFYLGTVADEVALERNRVRLVEPVSAGDLVSVHWGMAVQKLSRNEFEALKKYTRMNLDAVNSGV